ncbi:hypothetical protein AXE80_08150 [Wenyingzhuangia fucanilytica]|uniref:DUF5675 domain-containing protein n=1 Tax=Wenyingzhuangia fucanilytica TaxID=1790137 RepID=A0A1B1Y647_9FLAO|nr:DUF5675 family protein [Wenyingzhuangia fucanilytica]ANW96252.1 hypothetical protein AXE80_08150 [Wenyingzhuangia fucanilytica]
MDIYLHRTYFKESTNGALFIQDSFFGFCIELPWLENRRNVSCIPEGVYVLKPRYSQKFKHHLILENVKNRTLILIHPANDALKELKGCIAPVTCLSGIGKGTSSRNLLNKLVSKCYQAFDRNETVKLIIKS